MIDDQNVFGLLLNSTRNTLTMLTAEDQYTQDKEIESPLKVRTIFAIGPLTYRHSTQVHSASG